MEQKYLILGNLWTEIWNYLCLIWNQRYRVSLAGKFCARLKMPKCGIKKLCLGILQQKFKKNIALFEMNGIDFVKIIAVFCAKLKIFKFGIKITLFWAILGWKVKIHQLQCLVNKKIFLNFRTKNDRFRSFDAGMLRNNYHIWNQRPGFF